MPFTTPESRKKVDLLTEDEVRNILFTYKSTEAGFAVGDKCMYFYKKMMKKWNENSSWTTLHNIYSGVVGCKIQNQMDEDTKRAYELAFMVFFHLHGMPYEIKKRALNGDITGEDTVQQEVVTAYENPTKSKEIG